MKKTFVFAAGILLAVACTTTRTPQDRLTIHDKEIDAVIAQMYVARPDATVEWPAKELKAFDRVTLAAVETKTVTLEIPVKDLRYWNVDKNAWNLEHGKLVLLLGSASDDIRQQTEVTI